jgi:hypothetical protein
MSSSYLGDPSQRNPKNRRYGIYYCGQGIKDVISTILGLSRRKKVNL